MSSWESRYGCGVTLWVPLQGFSSSKASNGRIHRVEWTDPELDTRPRNATGDRNDPADEQSGSYRR